MVKYKEVIFKSSIVFFRVLEYEKTYCTLLSKLVF